MPWAALGGAAGAGGGEDGPGKMGQRQRAIVLEMLATYWQLFDNYMATI